MKILSFGSLNIDKVYSVTHFVRAGETVASQKMEEFCGGKGLNQSVALAQAGARVFHAGAVGKEDGAMLLQMLQSKGVDTSYVSQLPCPSGHAIIQVDPNGQNCILLYGGANQQITREQVERTLADFKPGDYLVLQNEINGLDMLMGLAYAKGMTIVLNPSPMSEEILRLPLHKVSYFLLNEVEAADLCGEDKSPEDCLDHLVAQFPQGKFVLTLGSQGCLYRDAHLSIHQPACPVQPVDTTAAGDTFTGFFIAGIAAGEDVSTALEEATKAAAIAISRKGAAPSIPSRAETLTYGG